MNFLDSGQLEEILLQIHDPNELLLIARTNGFQNNSSIQQRYQQLISTPNYQITTTSREPLPATFSPTTVHSFHQTNTKFKCNLCNKEFVKKQMMKIHQDKCTGIHLCVYCQKQFTSSILFHKHRCTQMKKCDYCCKQFSSYQWKKQHQEQCSSRMQSSPGQEPPFHSTQTSENCQPSSSHAPRSQTSRQPTDNQQPPSSHSASYLQTSSSHHISSQDSQTSLTLPGFLKTDKGVKCTRCQLTFKTEKSYDKHVCRSKQKTVRCRRCFLQFPNRHELYIHIREKHNQRGSGTTEIEMNLEDERLRSFYRKYKSFIYDHHELGQPQSFYNFPIPSDFSYDDIRNHLNFIYENQQQSFKINFSFGFMLQHMETQELRYFRAYSNDAILDVSFTINSREDLELFIQRISQINIMEEITRDRPNTKWRLVLLCNVRYYVVSTSYPLGAGNLPEFILRSQSIVGLTSDVHSHKYKDQLCLFRCIVYHKHRELFNTPRDFEAKVQQYLKDFSTHMEKDFSKGVDLKLMPEFESFFSIDINIFTLHEDGNALPVFKSLNRFKDIMYLNLYENHLSYVKNVKQYCQKYQCSSCKKLFKSRRDCNVHMKSCNSATNYKFPGGFYENNKTLFDELEEVGITVDKQDQFFNYFICFDFEAYLKKLDVVDDQANTIRTTQHLPISVSVASNVPGYEDPYCIVEDDQEKLVTGMLNYMSQIQSTSEGLVREKLEDVEEQLDSLINQWNSNPDEKQTFNNLMKKKFQQLKKKFELYCSQTPVLGFNSSRYDINLIKKTIARCLNLHESEHAFVIKKNNQYSCLANENFKFLDIVNYLAPGSSYSKFLKAFGVAESKGMFPYEFLDHPDKLELTELPSHQDFYSSLKDSNISEEDYLYLQKIWRDHDMKTFKDFLTWYNNLDVGPFVEAVEKLQDFYKREGIDMFKNTISVPGLSRAFVFKSAFEKGAHFSLFDQKNSDLYFTMLSNIIGGPSIIFHRYAEAGKTFIRGGAEQVKKVIGLDANALYLWAFDQEFPVGSFVRRRAEDNFKPVYRDTYNAMFMWMDFIAYTEKIKIIHQRNNGKEKRDGRYFADGYCAANNTVYQYDGCYFHGHGCVKFKDEKEKKRAEVARKRTADRDSYYKSLGYNVCRIWECDFNKMKKSNAKLRDFCDNYLPAFSKRNKGSLSEKQILDAVKSDELFGALEVDIHVPDNLKEHFSEMSPLFCTSNIPLDVIGSHMKEYAEQAGLSQQPRKLLIGGMKANNLLLATPLLRWYLRHGLVVTKIHQVVEYSRMRCFTDFVKKVSDARRAGDADPNKSIIADLNKLIGNSAYGSTIMNKLKHSKVKYVQGENQACMEVNNPRFKSLEDLGEDYFECISQHSKINLSIPISIGYFILQLAKLRMLEFYYDFLDVYIERKNFQMLQMDTDSFYFSISGEQLSDVVKPEYKQVYQDQLHGLCHLDHIDAADYWFPRCCCTRHRKHDSRTQGLFKVEYEGTTFYGLCSKTYIVQNGEDFKFSSKGISKNRVVDPVNIYKSVLETKKPEGSTNLGFIAKENTIFTYKQRRNGFSYFYPKRKVCDDGISTEPLDITLQPIPSKFRKLD